jgi:fructose-bisphosphate aldolase class I
MDESALKQTAQALVVSGKGILAADESEGTIKKRFDAVQVESTEENRRFYRELLFTTPKVEEFISGVIMFDETIRQKDGNGKPFPLLLSEKGIIPGIKVDKGAKDMAGFPGEKVTEGLDGLRERFEEYKGLGAKFSKWRAVIAIGEGIPTQVCIDANAEALARFAALSQEAGLTPIVEPEVLMDGGHDIGKCEEATYQTLKAVFTALSRHKVMVEGMLLKPNMILPGKESGKAPPEDIADSTLRIFKEVLPSELPGVVFLSGGQGPEEATLNLNALNAKSQGPWQMSFSYGRALQEPVLKAWAGNSANKEAAQKAFYHRAKMNGLARMGKYTPESENE